MTSTHSILIVFSSRIYWRAEKSVILGAILALPSYLSYDHYIVFTNIDSFAISHLVATPFSPATHRYNTLRGQRGPRGMALRAPLLMIGRTTSLPLHARRRPSKTNCGPDNEVPPPYTSLR